MAWIAPIYAPDEDFYEARTQFFWEVAIRFAGDDRPSNDPVWAAVEHGREIAIALVPAACTALGAWLGSRNGRKVRIKFGDIEAEAQTQEQLEELLALAQRKQQEIQQRNQPPKIIP